MGYDSHSLQVAKEAPVVDLTVEQGATWLVKWLIVLPPTGLGLSEAVRAAITGAKMQIRTGYGGTVLLTADTAGSYLTMVTSVAGEVTLTLNVPYAITTGITPPAAPGRTPTPTLSGKAKLGIYDLEITAAANRWKAARGDVFITPEVTL